MLPRMFREPAEYFRAFSRNHRNVRSSERYWIASASWTAPGHSRDSRSAPCGRRPGCSR